MLGQNVAGTGPLDPGDVFTRGLNLAGALIDGASTSGIFTNFGGALALLLIGQAGDAFGYACNLRSYVNSSGHVIHSPSCGAKGEGVRHPGAAGVSDAPETGHLSFREYLLGGFGGNDHPVMDR